MPIPIAVPFRVSACAVWLNRRLVGGGCLVESWKVVNGRRYARRGKNNDCDNNDTGCDDQLDRSTR